MKHRSENSDDLFGRPNFMQKTALQPTTFLRHNRQLRTLLLESQAWFCARDFSRLMGWPLNERTTRKLDVDQRRVMVLSNH